MPQLIRLAFVLFAISASFAQAQARTTTAILVDKKTNQLHVAQYLDGAYKFIKSYHATLGQVQGDKYSEGDLKTPEGIYTFKNKQTPPTLKPKFGKMAFSLNFPNSFDQIAGNTGSSIMLHATNEPERLKKNYDSEGCVVVNDDEIAEISQSIRVGLTPILVFSELTNDYLKPGQTVGLKKFFQNWISSWEGKNLDRYIDYYHSDFSANGMNRDQWKNYKKSLNERYSTIRINPEEVHYYRHPKYSTITFTQNYVSQLKTGGWGHRSRGTKILYVAEEAGVLKIISETYTNLMW